MNERIRQLAEQAKIDYELLPEIAREPVWIALDDELEKFAELIVKECARVARATPAPNFHEHLKQQLGHTWNMSAVEAGREIVKHFGVEE